MVANCNFDKEVDWMDRKELDYVLKNLAFMPGGTREACVKVKDFMSNFLKHLYDTGQVTLPPGHAPLVFPESCVTLDEFIEAVNVLMASAAMKKDEVPTRWNCDSDCRRVSYLFCFGQFNVTKNPTALCPFFIDEGNV